MKKWVFICCLFLGLYVHGNEGMDLSDADYVILEKTRKVVVDENGLRTIDDYVRIQLLTDEAKDYVGDVRIPYNGFRQKAELVSAETLTSHGERKTVEPSEARRMAAREFSGYAMYTDAKEFAFSMPGLQKDAVIEYHIRLRDIQPVLPGEAWDRFTFHDSAPVRQSRYEVKVPAQVQLNVFENNLPEGAKQEGGSWIWELQDLAPVEYEAGMPLYTSMQASVEWSTIQNWQTVRDWYRDLLRGRIQTGNEIVKRAEELTGGLKSDEEKIAALFHFVQQDIRYVGIELGHSAYTPHTAAECIDREYGDCKDQSVLLVSLLRSLNISASLALVRPQPFGYVREKAPSPAQFNHAIVYLPEQNLWLDPTHTDLPVFTHPANLDGVKALVIDDREDVTLQTVPVAAAEHHYAVTEINIEVMPDGTCRVERIESYHGRAGQYLRAVRTEEDKKEELEKYAETLETQEGFQKLLEMSTSDPEDLSQPFVTTNSYLTTEFFMMDELGRRRIELDGSEWTQPLSIYYNRGEARKHPYEKQSAQRVDLVLQLTLPENMSLAGLPRSIEKDLKVGSLKVESAVQDRVHTIRIRTIGHPFRIEPEDVSSVRRSIDRVTQRITSTLVITDDLLTRLEKGERVDVLNTVREKAMSSNADGHDYARLGAVYMHLHLPGLAVPAYKQAIRQAPEHYPHYQNLVYALNLRTLLNGAPLDRSELLAVSDKALDNVGPHFRVRMDRAQMYEIDKSIVRRFGGEFEMAAKEYQEILKDYENAPSAMVALMECYTRLNMLDELDDLAALMGEKNPYHPLNPIAQAMARSATGNPERAVAILQESSQDPRERIMQGVTVMELMWSLEQYDIAARGYRTLAGLGIQHFRYVADFIESMKDVETSLVDPAATGNPVEFVKAYSTSLYKQEREMFLSCFDPALHDSQFLGAVYEGIYALHENPDVGLAMLLSGQKVKTENLPGSDWLRVQMAPSREIRAISRAMGGNAPDTSLSMIMRPVEGTWQIVDFGVGSQSMNLAPLVIDRLLRAGEIDQAMILVEDMLARCRGTLSHQPPPYCGLGAAVFPDKASKIKALLAVSLPEETRLHCERKRRYIMSSVGLPISDSAFWEACASWLLAAEYYQDAGKLLDHSVKVSEGGERELTKLQVIRFIQMGELAAADELTRHIKESQGDTVEVRELQMKIALQLGDYSRASEMLKSLEQLATSPLATFSEKAELAKEMHDVETLKDLHLEVQDRADLSTLILSPPVFQGAIRIGEFELAMDSALGMLAQKPELGLVSQVAITLILNERFEDAHTLLRQHMPGFLKDPAKVPIHAILMLMTLESNDLALEVFRAKRPFLKPDQLAYHSFHHAQLERSLGNADVAETILRDSLNSIDSDTWPFHLTRFLLGEVSFVEMKKRSKSQSKSVQENHMTELFYYAAKEASLSGNKQKALSLAEKGLAISASDNFEYMLLRGLIRQLEAN